MVSRQQYDKCVAQCRTWEQKYNQLYTLYMKSQEDTRIANSRNVSNTFVNNNSEQYEYISKENRKLKERVRELEKNQ